MVALSDLVRKVIRALVYARAGLDRVARAGSVWDGLTGAPVATVLRRYSVRLVALEESLVGCMQAVDQW